MASTARIPARPASYANYKQFEIDGLKKDAQLQAQQLSSRNAQLILSLIISLLILLLLILTVRNFIRMKKVSLLLEERNKDIELKQIKLSEQNDELIALNEEIKAQQEEVTSQRDKLMDKNQEIENVYQKIT